MAKMKGNPFGKKTSSKGDAGAMGDPDQPTMFKKSGKGKPPFGKGPQKTKGKK